MPTPFEEFWGISEQDVIDAIKEGKGGSLPAGMDTMEGPVIGDPFPNLAYPLAQEFRYRRDDDGKGGLWIPELDEKYRANGIEGSSPDDRGSRPSKAWKDAFGGKGHIDALLGSLYMPGDNNWYEFHRWLIKASSDLGISTEKLLKIPMKDWTDNIEAGYTKNNPLPTGPNQRIETGKEWGALRVDTISDKFQEEADAGEGTETPVPPTAAPVADPAAPAATVADPAATVAPVAGKPRQMVSVWTGGTDNENANLSDWTDEEWKLNLDNWSQEYQSLGKERLYITEGGEESSVLLFVGEKKGNRIRLLGLDHGLQSQVDFGWFEPRQTVGEWERYTSVRGSEEDVNFSIMGHKGTYYPDDALSPNIDLTGMPPMPDPIYGLKTPLEQWDAMRYRSMGEDVYNPVRWAARRQGFQPAFGEYLLSGTEEKFPDWMVQREGIDAAYDPQSRWDELVRASRYLDKDVSKIGLSPEEMGRFTQYRGYLDAPSDTKRLAYQYLGAGGGYGGAARQRGIDSLYDLYSARAAAGGLPAGGFIEYLNNMMMPGIPAGVTPDSVAAPTPIDVTGYTGDSPEAIYDAEQAINNTIVEQQMEKNQLENNAINNAILNHMAGGDSGQELGEGPMLPTEIMNQIALFEELGSDPRGLGPAGQFVGGRFNPSILSGWQ
jgi:hypothetical protein